MMKLLCEENNLEYTGAGYIQCGRHVECPKKDNTKILGFDCIIYIDNLPEGCELKIPDIKSENDDTINIGTSDRDMNDHIVSHKNGSLLQIIPANEQIVHEAK